MPNPLPKSADVLRRVTQLANQEGFSELEHARLSREVATLIQQLGPDNRLLCAKAILRAKVGGADALDTFRQLVANDPGDHLVRLNHATALAYFGKPIEAYEETFAAWRLAEGDVETLDVLILRALEAGYLREAIDWLNQWRKECPEREHECESQVRAIQQFLEMFGPDDDALAALPAYVQKAADIAADMSVPVYALVPQLEMDEDSCWITFAFYLKAPPAVVAQASIRLAKELAEADLASQVGTLATSVFRGAA